MDDNMRHRSPVRAQLEKERISKLLARYPDVSADEARAILTFLRRGRYFDVGLLTSSARLRPNLDEFLKDHRQHFQVEPARAEAIVGVLILLIFALWAVWASLP